MVVKLARANMTDTVNAGETAQRPTVPRFLFIAALFCVIFISARLFIHPINNTDYLNSQTGLRAFWRGETPYVSALYYMPPWSAFFLAPLVNQPLETWLALDVALFATMIVDLGSPSSLLLLLHPAFIALIASSNPEWLVVGTGLWLLYRIKRGVGRGVAWLLLACKPQTTAFLLLFDGIAALRHRDWKAFGVAGITAVATILLYPQIFTRLSQPFEWSATVYSHYGVLGALAATLLVVAVRWRRRSDLKTLGLYLGPIWWPYMLEYGYTATAFTMRSAGWLRVAIYVAASIGLAFLFWRDYHVAEQIGAFGMVLLAAVLAPAEKTTRQRNAAS